MGQVRKPPDLPPPPRDRIEHETVRHGKTRDHHQSGGEGHGWQTWHDPDPRQVTKIGMAIARLAPMWAPQPLLPGTRALRHDRPECIDELRALAARRGHFYVGVVVVSVSSLFMTSFAGPRLREGGHRAPTRWRRSPTGRRSAPGLGGK